MLLRAHHGQLAANCWWVPAKFCLLTTNHRQLITNRNQLTSQPSLVTNHPSLGLGHLRYLTGLAPYDVQSPESI